MHSKAAAPDRGVSHSRSSYTSFCEAERVDRRVLVVDDLLVFDLDEDGRDAGSGMHRAD